MPLSKITGDINRCAGSMLLVKSQPTRTIHPVPHWHITTRGWGAFGSLEITINRAQTKRIAVQAADGHPGVPNTQPGSPFLFELVRKSESPQYLLIVHHDQETLLPIFPPVCRGCFSMKEPF